MKTDSANEESSANECDLFARAAINSLWKDCISSHPYVSPFLSFLVPGKAIWIY